MNGTVVKKGTTNSTQVTLSGLHTKWTCNFGVQALPGGADGTIHIAII